MSRSKAQADRERTEACAALSRVQAARPLKPPPYRFEGARVSAGARALAKDRKLRIA